MEFSNQFASFLIRDIHDNIIEHSCDPRTLNTCMNDKPDAPFDITPVFFKREVLDKYYNAPHKYRVSDGLIYFIDEKIFLRVDTDLPNAVALILVDLASLDYREQLHWKSNNIDPLASVSKAAYERWYGGIFSKPQAPDAVLIQKYITFYSFWNNTIGWPLFREKPDDKNSVLYSIHILSDEKNEKEFYDQILNLTKLFVDSLNVKKFPQLEGEDNKKGLSRFSAYLDQYHLSIPHAMVFMRNLQRLRSTKAAHIGSSEQKVFEYFKLNEYSYGIVLNGIFDAFNQLLDTLKVVAYKIIERSKQNIN